MSDDERMAYSVREAADELRISERTMRMLLASGKIRGIHIGARIVVPAAELRALLREEREPIPVR